jgi:NAD(P)-dependent dehydrogenase (short-subunit alcohol dehydrogenase family)
VGSDRYNVSKLLNIFMAREVGKLAGREVCVNVVNPGLCHSGLGRESGAFLAVLKFFLARSTEVGSRNLVWACTHDTPAGAYVSDCRVTEYVASAELGRN